MATPEDLKTFLSSYNIESALRTICLGSQYLLKQQKSYEPQNGFLLAGWSLAYLAQEALCHCPEHFGTDFGANDLAEAIVLYESFPDPIEFAEKEANPHAHLRAQIRLAHLQFPFQESIFWPLARTSVLFEDIAKATTRGLSVDMDRSVEQLFGLTTRQTIRVGALMTAAAYAHPAPVMDLRKLAASDLPYFREELRLPALRKFANGFGRTKADFRLQEPRARVLSGFERFALNRLQDTPLVRLDENHIMIPVPTYLVQRVSTGLFFALADDAGKRGSSIHFRVRFGYVFEDYIGKQLAESDIEFGIIGEREYGEGKRSPDWILYKDDVEIIIECKSSQLKVEANTYAEGSFLDDEGHRIFVKSLNQIHAFVENMEKDRSEFPELANSTMFFGFVVCYAPLYHVNSFYHEMFGSAVRPKPAMLREVSFLDQQEFEGWLVALGEPGIVQFLHSQAEPGASAQPETAAFLSDLSLRFEPDNLVTQRAEALFGFRPPAMRRTPPAP